MKKNVIKRLKQMRKYLKNKEFNKTERMNKWEKNFGVGTKSQIYDVRIKGNGSLSYAYMTGKWFEIKNMRCHQMKIGDANISSRSYWFSCSINEKAWKKMNKNQPSILRIRMNVSFSWRLFHVGMSQCLLTAAHKCLFAQLFESKIHIK